MDFTLLKYEELCKAIVDSDYTPMSVYTYLEAQPHRCIILRHDVDRKPEQAMKMAELERIEDINPVMPEDLIFG